MSDEAPTVDEATLVRVEARLKADILWAVTEGPGWHPGYGADPYEFEGWGPAGLVDGTKACGVCAIGALVVRGQPPIDDDHSDDVTAAAKMLGVPRAWVRSLYVQVLYPNDGHWRPGGAQVAALAGRLRAYGDELQAAKGAGK